MARFLPLLLLFLIFDGFASTTGQVVDHFKVVQQLSQKRHDDTFLGAPSMFSGKSMFEKIVGFFEPENGALSPTDFPQLQNLTLECVEDMSLLALALVNTSLVPPDFLPVLAKLTDAQGVVPAGALRGARTIFGFKQECDLVEYTIPHMKRQFKGMYGRLYMDGAVLAGGNKTCDPTMEMGFDFCLPQSCSREDLITITSAVNLSSVLDPASPGENPTCTVATMDYVKTSYNYKSWISLFVLATVVVLAILATIVDYFGIPDGHKIRTQRPFNLLLAFSIYTNISEIMTVKKSNQSGQISSIHFIRVFSIIWVMTGHVFLTYMSSINNFLDFMKILDYLPTQVIVNGFYSVDNFFFIGAVLLSFIFFKELDRNRQNVMSLQGWFMFYFHRYVRLSPSYFMAIAVVTWVYYPLTDHYIDRLTPNLVEDKCNSDIWQNVLYVNNFAKTQNCFGHSWYLAADMQMYVLSPVLLVALAFSPVGGVVWGLILLALSTIGNMVTIYVNHYPPSVPIVHPIDPKAKNMEYYTMIMYYAFWIRCQIYIIGILVGYLLQKRKRLHIPAAIQVISWILTISLMGTVLFGLFDYNRNEVSVSLFWSAMYSALSRIAWGLGLGWIVVACFYGYGGFLNRFMSWNIWVPISRLSYAAYLIHISVIDFVFIQSNGAIIFTNVYGIILYYLIPVIGITFFLALLWSSLFELPIMKIEMILLRQRTKSKTLKTDNQQNGKTNPQTNGMDQWVDDNEINKKL